jgi:hypothetical protein
MMAKIQYQDFNFREATLSTIEKANDIIDEYLAEGYELTLRQLYYQFVARGIIPNKDSEYKRLGSVVNDGRLAGLVDWNAIVDRTRKIQINGHWDSPEDIIQESANCYAIDTRETQEVYVEVWIEKEALAGILEQACEPLDVPYFSCRGYVSQSAMWRAGRRIKRELNGSHCSATILHFGDHDPSGIDMTRDIGDRLKLFEVDVEVKRVALNMEQVEQYNPPPNPAKTTDSRYDGYIAEYGEESWELDALDPRTITRLIQENVIDLTDLIERKRLIARQESQREKLQTIADNFDKLDI